MTLTLVTGPARSGKSEWAEALAAQAHQPVVYLATARALPEDAEWSDRLQRHRDRRPPDWRTLEVPTALAQALDAALVNECWLVDSLGTWVANLLEQDEDCWEATTAALIASLQATPAALILVAEETGWGVVPAYPLGRRFRDRLGRLTRQVGAIAPTVYLVTGGYALNLVELGTPLPPP
ncbi:MAG: bifunctional adenosylcobinamide kinase/adenosylcobinamide-phosphate guanylyltransferase [Kaiparowitsia implicata GSE-PSE-MK54-09C]|jgi:adenosylcobinamide kinase/adenosylcobinamide-phosphate guanylyltransferase|nr:bifunctional adenosylcobinamide kinase/adenosylcobinamide-phosphate guanylyltransferase [Kaiparowitsia implicata GSE-PSE-MK54-09C]